jgi:hypothetical protein
MSNKKREIDYRSLSRKEQELIDYIIKENKKPKDQSLKEWNQAGFFGFLFILVVMLLCEILSFIV